jgi:hypothetical protein
LAAKKNGARIAGANDFTGGGLDEVLVLAC